MNNGDQNSTSSTGWQFNPGDTVTPGTPQPTTTTGQMSQQPPVQETALPSSVPATPSPADTSTLAEEDDNNVDFSDQTDDTFEQAATGDQISWTASEYVAHHKTATWYVALVLIAVVAAVVAYFATKDWITAVSIILIAFVFGLSAARKPRVLEYRLDNRGLTIAKKPYSYRSFRSFAVIDEGAFSSIVFVPLKRFMPMLTIYYAPEDENRIVQIIADHLPVEQRKHDAIDALLHKIRF